jgi:hypothetical protein
MYNLKVVTHYENGCGGDYSKVTVEMDGMLLREFGDYYHDKGHEKADAYIMAFYDLFGLAEVQVSFEQREDTE